ncbi:hypothetical protein ABIC63_003661 [Pseudacidovorax sp. 1753]|uniref:hypothetical protein n=1 Tax=Pseudacidovorax sp. 1753 TaxID=3156419 RepID=UPI00339B6611
MAKLEEVFGVTSKPVLSYVERKEVDDSFREALTSHKQIIVYGSSKQGKTALVSKYLPYDDNILVSLTPKTSLLDVYQTILSKAGVKILSATVEKASTESAVSIGAKFRAMIPFFGEGSGETTGSLKAASGNELKYEEIVVNLELPQTVADLLKRVNCDKWVILENFHYLTDEVQQQFAFDLRAYQELGVKFVILGVWREKNRMAQFNGDLLDRTIEVPVEPWNEADFRRVVAKGGADLRVALTDPLIDATIEASFSSIGVFQELVKNICLKASVKETMPNTLVIGDLDYLKDAIRIKTDDYAARHSRALEAIAAGHNSGGGQKGDLPPLFLPYYLVRVILEGGFDGIANGARRGTIHEKIKAQHHRGNDVRASDMTNLLGGIANLQSVKAISPPIFAYDAQQRVLQVVDSTFYFFIKNADVADVLEALPNPLEQA